MNNEYKVNTVSGFIYSMLIYALILDIGGSFGLKNLSFLILIIYELFFLFFNIDFKMHTCFLVIEGMLFFIWPLLLLYISVVFWDVSIQKVIGQISAFIIWLLIPLLITLNNKELIRKFENGIFLCTILVIGTFIVLYIFNMVGRNDLIARINNFSMENSLGYLGRNPIFVNFFIPNVFYRWTFLLIPGILLYINKSNLKFILGIIAIFMTLSTGTITFFFIGLVLILLFKKAKIRTKNFTGSILGLSVIFFIYCMLNYDMTLDIISMIFNKFSVYNPSTSIKIGHIKSILKIIFSDIKIFLFGMGLGSEFYSSGVNDYVINVEVSHFNFIRQFGIIYAIAFFIYVFTVCIKLLKTDDVGIKLGIGIFCLFLAAGTNPLLISPIFFLPLVIGRIYIYNYIKEAYKENDEL